MLPVISSQALASTAVLCLRHFVLLSLLAGGVVGCRCEGTPGPSTPTDCLAVCQARVSCGEDPAQCAAECSNLRLLRGAESQASQLLTCVARHGCETDLRYAASLPADPCAAPKAALRDRLIECRSGDALHRVIPGGSVQVESLGCIGSAECSPLLDAGASGSRCESPSVCGAHCCSPCPVNESAGQRAPVARVRACVSQRCASQAQACAALAALRPCKGSAPRAPER